MIGNIDGREAIRLRSDILWAAQTLGRSGGADRTDVWRSLEGFSPLTDVERQDILRAEIGYGLAEDTLGLGRFRER